MRTLARTSCVALTALSFAAGPAAAQGLPNHDEDVWQAPNWVGDATFLGMNALLGGVTAGTLQELRGGSFQDGFTRGALGGGVVYVGKRVAAQRFDGAGLLGRQVGAVGSSIVRNASDGVGTLERLVLPLGPVRLYVEPAAERRVRGKIAARTFYWITYAVFHDALKFDLGATLSAGAPVFNSPGHLLGESAADAAAAKEVAGIVLLGRSALGGRRPDIFAHERVHVLQEDMAFLIWDDPFEDWAVSKIPGLGRLSDYVDIGMMPSGLIGMAGGSLDHGDRPWEIEAGFLGAR